MDRADAGRRYDLRRGARHQRKQARLDRVSGDPAHRVAAVAMVLEHWSLLTRRERLQLVLVVIALVALGVYIYVALAKTVPSRHIVLASGPDFGAYHEYAKRYQALLAR